MSSLTDDIFSQISGTAMQQIGQQLGTGQAQTAGAVAAVGLFLALEAVLFWKTR